MRRLTAIIIGLLSAFTPLIATASDYDGGIQSIFSMGASARAMGMGNGFTGLADDASAVYYNPAGIAFIPSQQISLLHASLFMGTNYEFASYVYPYDRWLNFGAAVIWIGTGDIGRRDKDYNDLGTFDANQMQFLLSYAVGVADSITAGVSLKLAYQSIDTWSDYGYGLDIGGRMNISDRLHAGVMIQDLIGPRIKLLSASERTPFTLKAGASYLLLTRDRWPVDLLLSADLSKPERRSVKFNGGAEVTYREKLIGRLGMDQDRPTIGVGVKTQIGTFDAAYNFTDGDLNSDRLLGSATDRLRISWTFAFGTTKQQRIDRADSLMRDSLRLFEERLRQSLKPDSVLITVDVSDDSLVSYFLSLSDSLRGQGDLMKARDAAAYAKTKADRWAASATDEQRAEAISKAAISQNRLAELDRLITETADASLQAAVDAESQNDLVTAYERYKETLTYGRHFEQAQKGMEQAERRLTTAQRIRIGVDYFNNRKLNEAKPWFTKALPDSTAQWYLDQIKDLERRRDEVTTLEQLQRDSTAWRNYVDGLEAFRQGNYKEAIDFWKKVRDVYPNQRNTVENIDQAERRLSEQQNGQPPR
jgi:tetratricopeptide (TPR) repeat protein